MTQALNLEPEKPSRGRELGERIRAARLRKQLSIESAARRYARETGLSLTRQGWSYWESHGCSLEQIDAVARVLDTTPAELLGFGRGA